MAISTSLIECLSTLEQVRASFALDATKLRDAETVEDLELVEKIPTANFAEINEDELNGWFAVFGNSLRLESMLEDDEDPRARWTANWQTHDANELALHRGYCDRSVDSRVKITLTLDKAALVQRLQSTSQAELGAPADVHVKLFFFGNNLCQILSGDYDSFEESFLEVSNGEEAVPDQRLLILVADSKGRLQGLFLGIFGIDHCDQLAGFFTTAPPFGQAKKARDTMQGINWDDRPKILTPDFFAVGPAAEAGDLTTCREELVRLQNRLSVAFLANRTHREKGQRWSTFEGSRSVTMSLGDARNSSHIYSLYTWAYDPDAAAARLEIVRRVVASRIPTDPAAGFSSLVGTSRELLSECQVQFELLVDKNIAESFKYQQEAEEAVRRYVDGVGDHIKALVKEVVDNAYKTVGLLVGIIIAYLLEPTRSPIVLVLGTVGYIAYILFVRFFYLTSYQEDLQERQEAFNKKHSEIAASKILRPSVLSRLDEEIEGREQQFSAKYKSVTRLYYVFCALALLFLAGWFVVRWLTPDAARSRGEILETHAKKLQVLEYEVRADLKGWDKPDRIMASTGEVFTPELAAVSPAPASGLVIAEFVGCGELTKPATLPRLKILAKVAGEKNADVHVLTQEVCGGKLGPDRLRKWLKAHQLPDWSLWTP